MLSGIVNVDKPAGITSHDVVDRVRSLAGQRKVGHAGTLDPLATGVLLVCLGAATRVAEFLAAGRKRYRAGIVLGTATDTYDAEGKITDCGGRTDFGREEIESALSGFVGRIEQVPPAFSAIKRDGEPLYRLARRGERVETRPRTIEIDEAAVVDWVPGGSRQTVPLLIIEVQCSPGTYIRSLAHDLGRALGSGAYLSTLVRLRSGRFGLEDSVSLGRLEEAFQHHDEARYLMAIDEALLDWPALIATPDDCRRIVRGLPVEAASAPAPGEGDQGQASRRRRARCRAYSSEGEFLAILGFHAEEGLWWPEKVFVTPTRASGASAGATVEP